MNDTVPYLSLDVRTRKVKELVLNLKNKYDALTPESFLMAYIRAMLNKLFSDSKFLE
jgi:hypothetical protein